MKVVSKELEDDTLIGNTRMDTLKSKIKVHLIDKNELIYKYRGIIFVIFVLSLFIEPLYRYLIFSIIFIYIIMYFIKTKTLNTTVDQLAQSVFTKLNQSVSPKILINNQVVELKCYNCHASINKTENACSECGVELFTCIICKRIILHRDEIYIHPVCMNAFHKTHILPYVGDKYICPICKEPLSNEIIEIYEYN